MCLRNKIPDVNKTEHIELRGTMSLLNFMLQVFSLDSTDRRISKNEKYWFITKSIASALIIGVIDMYSLCWKVENLFSLLDPSIVFTDVTQMIYDYLQYIVDLIFIYKYGTETSQVYLKNFDCIDKILDMSHKKETQEKMLKLAVFLLSFWLIVSAFDFGAWYLVYGILTPTFYAMYYVFFLIKILTNLDLTVQIFNVECRLRVIGVSLQECYKKTDSLPAVMTAYNMKDDITDSICNENWFYGKGFKRAKIMRTRIYPLKGSISSINSCSYKMKLMTRCYLLIGEQCAFINKMFGFRILLNSLSLLIDMVRLLNIAVRLFIGAQKTTYNNDSGYLPAVSTILRFMICVTILTSLVYHCERAYDHTDRIVNITNHILINKNPDEALRSSLKELQGLVISKPISFNTSNFFRLGYPYLVSTMSVVATYTIILLQDV